MGHHFVPRFYLKNFAFNEEKTLVYSMNKEGKIPDKPSPISKICAKENYNTLQQENKQGQLERFHSSVLEDFIKNLDSRNFKLSCPLVELVCFIMGNNLLIREKVMEELDRRLKVQIKGDNINRTVPIHKGYRGKFDLSIAFSERAYKELESWRFEPIGVADNSKFFITSDNPVSLFNPENVAIPTEIGVTFNYNDERIPVPVEGLPGTMHFPITLKSVSFERDVVMVFPITHSYCMLGFSDRDRHASYISFMKGNDRKGTHLPFLNILTYAMCNRAVYAYSKNFLRKVDADKHIFQNYCGSNRLVPSFDLVLSINKT